MARLKPIRKVIWAVDPFEPLAEDAIRSARSLFNLLGAEIEPIYVHNPVELNLNQESVPDFLESSRPDVELLALQKLIDQAAIPGAVQAKVLIQSSPSLKHASKMLVEYAEQSGAQAIFVNSHAPTGLDRFLSGSFADSLLKTAHVPVLVTGPHLDIGGFNSILFPTDLGDYSRALFEYTVELASAFGAKVTVFHSIPTAIEPVFQSGVYLLGGGWIPVPNYSNEDREKREKLLQAWTHWASRRGVIVDYILDDQGLSLTESILAIGKDRKSNLIVLASQNGNIARKLVKDSSCPIWIIHPDDLKSKAAA